MIAIRQYDVVGEDASGAPHFVGHLALAGEERTGYTTATTLPVLHMGPPLERAGECRAHCVGSANLTADEQFQIRLFSDEIDSELREAQIRNIEQYVISPHVDAIRREDHTVVCRRFSCAGFVIEAYREARIDVLRTEGDNLPLVSLDALKTQYPRFARHLDNRRLRNQLGIPGEGPWPVVLAGYVLNALDRAVTEIRLRPFRASPGDEFFPSRRRRQN
jgi:hypothetical protein